MHIGEAHYPDSSYNQKGTRPQDLGSLCANLDRKEQRVWERELWDFDLSLFLFLLLLLLEVDKRDLSRTLGTRE